MTDFKLAELSMEDKDPIIRRMHQIIRFGVKMLAVLMTLLILWGIGDVIWIMVQRLIQPPFLILRIGDILAVFGGFSAVKTAFCVHRVTFHPGEHCNFMCPYFSGHENKYN